MVDCSNLDVYEAAWCQGDWTRLLELMDLEASAVSSQSTRFALMLAGTALQVESKDLSRQMITKALKLSSNSSIKSFMLSVYQVQLGRVATLAGQQAKALVCFQNAFAQGGELIQPLFYNFIIQEAEYQLQQDKTREAIQSFQDIASILQESTPEEVYHRMSHCYAVNRQGFGGTQDENHTFGDCHKHDLLEFFHTHLQPEFYFEIGVDEGLSLARAQGKALGVDARPELNLAVELPDQAQILGISSDAFFREQAQQAFTLPPDLAFIDGMHLFEFALRDFMNLERYAAPYSLVGIDDIYPCHPIQAERRRRSGAWAGDVWKLLPVLQTYRPDLTLITLPCSTTGLLLIAGLDANNTQLQDHYEQIIQDYQADLPVPESILQRSGSIPSDHPVVSLLLSVLKRAREEQADTKQVRAQLELLIPFIEEAKKHPSLPTHPKTLEQLKQEKIAASTQTYQAQLFFPQLQGRVYSESASMMLNLLSSDWQEAVFSFKQDLEQYPLRFDPSAKPGLFEIKLIQLLNANSSKLLLELSTAQELRALKVQGDCFQLSHSEKFLCYAYASDPQILLPVVKTLNADLELRVSIRHVSDGDELRELWNKHLGGSKVR